MKMIIFNDDNLTLNDIDDKIIKARAIIINDNKEIYMSIYAGMYLFPGGKVEDNEKLYEGASREVKEETGIDIDFKNMKPFLLVKQYLKDYPIRDSDIVFSNRSNETYYYLVKTNETINTDKMHLMDNEKNNGFITIRFNIDEIQNLLKTSNINNYRNKFFIREMEVVLNELKKII